MTRLRALGILMFCLGLRAEARVTDFSESHGGILLGLGTYPFGAGGWDAVSQMVPRGTTVQGSSKSWLLPLRFGAFVDLSRLTAEAYYRFITNSGATWGTSGGLEGAGKSTWRSQGFGGKGTLHLLRRDGLRFGISGVAEYVGHKVDHEYSRTGFETQRLTLAQSSFVAAGGLSAGLWLGDLWVLTSDLLYYRGTPSAWKVSRPDSFLGSSWEKGNVVNPQSGDTVKADFSGWFFELGMRLNFQSF